MQATTDQTRIENHIERIRKGAAATLALLDWLDAEGIRALYICVDSARAKPIIQIAHSKKCAWLKDKHAAYKHMIANHSTTWRADILGCRLQWVERVN